MATYHKTYTQAVSAGTTEIVIKKSNSTGNGLIPNDISIRSIKLYPANAANQIQIKGMHASSEWITLHAGEAYEKKGLAADTWTICYLKAGSTITVNMEIEGQ